MKRLALHWWILIGLALGVVYSIVASHAGWLTFTKHWISPWGTIFINLLKLIAVPLVLFSIIGGIASLTNVASLGRLGIKTLGFYVVTTTVSVIIGLTLVNTVQPGNRIDRDTKAEMVAAMEREMADETSATANFLAQGQSNMEETKERGPLQFVVDMVPDNIFAAASDNQLLLRVIVFAILFGIALVLIPSEKAKPVAAVVDGITAVVIKIVEIIMKGAPFFVFALMAGLMTSIADGDPSKIGWMFVSYAWYGLLVIGGLAILALVFYPLVLRLFVRRIKYVPFFKAIREAQIVAFSTSSSAATLPVTMDCVQDNLGVSKEVSSFMLPIGATINMDGTSLYQGITAVFLAQFFGADLTIANQIFIMGACVIASIASPAVPSAGLVMLMVVLEGVGLPGWWVALIFPIDRILDMCRTVVNITGDSTAASVVAKSEGELNYPVGH